MEQLKHVFCMVYSPGHGRYGLQDRKEYAIPSSLASAWARARPPGLSATLRREMDHMGHGFRAADRAETLSLCQVKGKQPIMKINLETDLKICEESSVFKS